MKELINLRRILKRPRSVARVRRRGAHPLRRLAPAAWLAAPLLAALLLPLAVVPQRGDNSRRLPPAVPQATAAPAPCGNGCRRGAAAGGLRLFVAQRTNRDPAAGGIRQRRTGGRDAYRI